MWRYPYVFPIPDIGGVLEPQKCVSYFLGCPPDFYWNEVISGTLSSGVALQFSFLFQTTSQADRGDPLWQRFSTRFPWNPRDLPMVARGSFSNEQFLPLR